MTTLSWMLILVSALSGLKNFAIMGITILGIALTIGLSIYFISLSDPGDGVGKTYRGIVDKFKTQMIVLWVGCTLMAALIPADKIMYSIVAIELGEEVVSSEEGQELLNDVKKIIKSYIPEEN